MPERSTGGGMAGIVALNPIFVSWSVRANLASDYTIFEARNHLSAFQLLFFPLYYTLALLPVFAMCIFQTRKLVLLNAALVTFYIISFIGTLYYIVSTF